MAKFFFQLLVLACVAAGLVCGAGCKGKGGPPVGDDAQAAEAAKAVPDGNSILTALNNKDYEGAVSGLSKAQASVTGDQQVSFGILKQYVKEKLLEASGADPKAADALNALRMMTQGR